MLACLDEDVVAVPFGAKMEGRTYRGHEGVLEWWQKDLFADWDHFDPQPQEFHVFGDRLVVFGRWKARGRNSGVELDVAATWVIDIPGDKIVRWQTYTDRDEALRDAGVTEEDVGG
jgi:ketosteroid isomerase-like protein